MIRINQFCPLINNWLSVISCYNLKELGKIITLYFTLSGKARITNYSRVVNTLTGKAVTIYVIRYKDLYPIEFRDYDEMIFYLFAKLDVKIISHLIMLLGRREERKLFQEIYKSYQVEYF